MSEFRRRLMMVGSGGSEDVLPDGYTRIEYLLAVPLGAYIDTGYTPNINTEFEIDFQQEYLSCDYPTLYGTRNSDNGSQRFYMHTMSTFLVINYGNGGKTIYTTWSDRYNLHIDSSGIILNDVFYSFDVTPTNVNPSKSALLFGLKSSTVTAEFCGKIYLCQIKEGGTLIHRYIPCINPNSVYGMYDVVGDTFKGSGSGSYVFSGPPLSVNGVIPSGYEKCSWIQNPSTAYIDTGYTPNQLYTVSTEIERTVSDVYQFICSSHTPYGFAINNSNKIVSIVNNKWSTGQSIDLGKKYVVEMTNGGNVYVDKTKTISSKNSATASQTLKLFTWDTVTSTSNRGKMKMYNFRLYSSNGTLLCDYQPAIRKSDGEYGMWDFVTNTFLTSPDGTSFLGE